MKHIRQHVAQRKVVWVNKIVVTTIKSLSQTQVLKNRYFVEIFMGGGGGGGASLHKYILFHERFESLSSYLFQGSRDIFSICKCDFVGRDKDYDYVCLYRKIFRYTYLEKNHVQWGGVGVGGCGKRLII
jgi:hypothetical protein